MNPIPALPGPLACALFIRMPIFECVPSTWRGTSHAAPHAVAVLVTPIRPPDIGCCGGGGALHAPRPGVLPRAYLVEGQLNKRERERAGQRQRASEHVWIGI
eukprot:scaffold1638_cov98-Isochrysis_galbana.AAC.2